MFGWGRKRLKTAAWSLLRFLGYTGDDLNPVTSKNYSMAYRINPWVYTSVRVIGASVAGVPWKVQRWYKGENAWRDVDRGTNLAEVLRWVNDEDDWFSTAEETASWLALLGNAYWKLLRPSAGADVIGMQALPADRVTIKRGETGVRTFEVDLGQAKKEILRAEDICHFRTFNILGSEYGMSAVSPLEQLINCATALLKFNYEYFKGGGMPAAVWKISLPEGVDPTIQQQRELLEQWEAFRRPGQANAPLIMGTESSFDKVGGSVDSDISVTLPDFIRECIHAAFGTPPATVGILKGAGYANLREQHKQLFTAVVIPMCYRMADTMNSQFVPRVGDSKGLRLWPDFDGIDALQADQVLTTRAAGMAISSGALSINEARDRLFGLPRVEMGDTQFLSKSLVTLEDAVNPPEPPAPVIVQPTGEAPAGDPEPTVPEKPPANAPPPAAQPAPKRVRIKAGGDAHGLRRKATYSSLNARRDELAAEATLRFGTWYERRVRAVEDRLAAKPALAEPKAVHVKGSDLDEIVGSEDEWYDDIQQEESGVIAGAFLAGAGIAYAMAHGVGSPDWLRQPRFERLNATRATKLRPFVTDEREALRDVIADELAGGAALAVILAVAAEWGESRVEGMAGAVARAEVGASLMQGALGGFQEAEAGPLEWISVLDEVTRDNHGDMDGQVHDTQGRFTFVTRSGETLSVEGPMDEQMGPEDACECRCVVGMAAREG